MSNVDCFKQGIKVKNNYEESITFTVFNNSWVTITILHWNLHSIHWFSHRSKIGQVSTFDENLTSLGCDADENFAVVVHGWKESVKTPWVSDTIENLLKYRGGCVVFIDYSNYSMVVDYFRLTPHFYKIAEVLLRKVKQIGNYDKLFMYGFSFGSRLCFEVGAQLGHQIIDRIDACDPAGNFSDLFWILLSFQAFVLGPGFDGRLKAADPRTAARNVACINTSTDKGTNKYNCHQNFLMGKCGKHQMAAGKKPLGDHGLCPYFYNSAFENEFKADNHHNCTTKFNAVNVSTSVRMGYFSTLER